MKQTIKYILIILTLLNLPIIKKNIHAMNIMPTKHPIKENCINSKNIDLLNSLVKLVKQDKETLNKNSFEKIKKIAASIPQSNNKIDFSYFLILKISHWIKSHEFKEHSCLFTPKEKNLINLVDQLRTHKNHNNDKYKETYLTIVSETFLTNKTDKDLTIFLLKTVDSIYNS